MTTKIEWVRNPDGTRGKTWNPVHGCTPVSAGCANCYAKRMSRRLAGRHGYPPNASECPVCGELFKQFVAFCPEHANETLIRHSSFDVTPRPDRLEQPLRWHKSKMIFVCSMGDLFHENVPDAFIAGVLKTIHQANWHVFQVLTKRPQRALDFIQHFYGAPTCFPDNVWFGVSVENQQTADERRESFSKVPAAVKFVSYEPALGPVDWSDWEFVDQIISGGETGPGARPSPPGCHEGARDFCQENDIAYFFKSWGKWAPGLSTLFKKEHGGKFVWSDGLIQDDYEPRPGYDMRYMEPSRRGRSNHLLDGKEWREYPK